MEIEHFSHEHPLILCEDQEEDGKEDQEEGEAVRCAGCDLAVTGGPSYSCIKCNYFLHKSCAEMPRHMTHLIHQKHPLTLLPRPPVDEDCKCDACHRRFKTFAYHCSLCRFTIDSRCASLPLTVQHESHEHPFTLLPKSASFLCDACGKNCEGISYLCTTCLLWVHPECAALPRSVNISTHLHDSLQCLHLTRNIPWQYDYEKGLCRICCKSVNPDYWFYYCDICTLRIAHVACATSKSEPIRDDTTVTKNNRLKMGATKTFNLINEDLIKNISLGDETVATKLWFHLHEHCLNLCEDVLPNGKCDGCARPILAAPYYSCQQCNFHLHISCSKLPRNLRHPLHPEHQLYLILNSPYLSGIFRCEACTNLCNGFTYSCDECNFNLDVACSSLSATLKHDGHEHLLVLGQETSSCEECSACGEDCVGFTYGCGDCNFKLDANCAILPRTVKHERHRHKFTLAFSSIEDDADQYYCNMCENPRNPNHWFYYCADCELSSHLGCMRKEYPYIKFGGTYKGESNHPHRLTFVQKTKDNPTCGKCGYACESLAFECAECKFNIHWMCQDHPEDLLEEIFYKVPFREQCPMYLLDKTVYMMTHDAKEICLKEKRSTKLKHFTHDHFLTLGYVQNKMETCFGCKLNLVGPCYQCWKCRIYLHKLCAEAPPVLQHWDHNHPLNLNLFEWPRNLFTCSLCCKFGESYGYQCKDCNYNLHIQCAF